MNTVLRLATLTIAITSGLTAAPPKAADATLGRDQQAVTLTEAERWSLRPTYVTAETMALRPSREILLSDLPDERRTVRIVYEGYGEASSLTGAH